MEYSNKITLIKNNRGVYDLDTTKGCYHGMLLNKKGCYGECYAARFANQYGYSFYKTELRKFISVKHVEHIRNLISNINMPFVRIGVSGDPSENWKHTISVIGLIYGLGIDIVIVTKHWKELTYSQLKQLNKLNVCVNTSISALDNNDLIKHRLLQYNRLKDYCKSVLRVVTCKFNTTNLTGMVKNNTQNELLSNSFVIDNVLRVSFNNVYLTQGIIKADYEIFLSSKALLSKHDNSIHTGYCNECTDMCGIKLQK